MYKIKEFIDYGGIEKHVNEWLKENLHINIKELKETRKYKFE